MMTKPFRPIVAGASTLAVLIVAACSTDNGGVFGENFAPPGQKLDAGSGTTPVPGSPEDAGEDASADAAPDAPPVVTCTGTGTVAVLAGDDASLSGAVQVNGAAWTGGAIGSGAAKSIPSLVAFGTGFAGVTRGPSDALQAVTAGTSFGASATAIGTAATKGSPALAVVGTTAHVAYLDGANLFFHGTNGGSGWDAATDPVKANNVQSFGPSAPALAGAGADLVFAQTGGDQKLYTQTLSGTTWGAGAAVSTATTFNDIAPSMVSVTGTNDLVVVYAEQTTKYITWSARDAGSKAWSAPAHTTDMIAVTDQPMQLAVIAPTKLLLAFHGTDGKGYLTTGTINGASIAWTSPAAVVPGGVDVVSAPAVAKGVCGDDAIVVYASGGSVKATRLRGTTWSSPETVTGASGTRVAVATR